MSRNPCPEGAIRRGVERYNDHRETLQHRIARRVEEMLLG